MSALLAFTFAAMASLGAPPREDLADVAVAIAEAAEERPVVGGDARRTAALLVVTAWAESRFDVHAVGDGGRSCGLFGIWVGRRPERCALLAADHVGAARMARDMLEESLRVCRARPPAERLGLYMGGACDRGLGQSRYRWRLAERLARTVREEIEPT